MAIHSLQALMDAGAKEDLFDVLLGEDCVDRGVTPGDSLAQMTALFAAIRRAQSSSWISPAFSSQTNTVRLPMFSICSTSSWRMMWPRLKATPLKPSFISVMSCQSAMPMASCTLTFFIFKTSFH